MAMARDLEVEMNARILLAFYQQWGEPAAGLALGREGMEIARRRGSRSYGFLMVGNAVIVAFRVGEWDWAASIVDEWLATHSHCPLIFTQVSVHRYVPLASLPFWVPLSVSVPMAITVSP